MDDLRKIKILSLYDGENRVLPILHEFEQFTRRSEIYSWLLKNGYKGEKLFDFYAGFQFSKIRFGKYVLTQIEKSKKQSLIVGRDLF